MIGTGHGLSHFYLLALPPLFPLLKDAFDVSYTALGLLITVINVATAAAQVPAGVLIDRIGAKGVLIGGLALMGLAMGLMGFVSDYWMLVALVAVAGLGNSVFHPADYVILSSSIDEKRVGFSFSVHTLTGNIGFMLAPVTMIALAELFDWRIALMVAGCFALVAVTALALFGDALHDEAAVKKRKETPALGLTGPKALLTRPVVMLFFFFMTASMVTGGVQAFSVTAIDGFHGIDLTLASGVLTAFLVAQAVGVLLGGLGADRTRRHGLAAALAMIVAAALFLLLGAFPLPFVVVLACFAVIGLLLGSIRPARDMMVKAASPPGATGRVFGFVSTGINAGSAITPPLFGLILDQGEPRLTFILLAVFTVIGIATLAVVRKPRTSAAVAPAE